MFHENYLKDINRNLFKPKLKSIKDTKAGDAIIFRGGTYIDSGKKIDSQSFVVGVTYIAAFDYRPNTAERATIWFKDHLNHPEENGHITVVKDSKGRQNGWNASLFELV